MAAEEKDHVRVRIEGRVYDFFVAATLQSLTGKETIALEDYLGGWSNFRQDGANTRSLVVIVWLAKRQAGEHVTFDEIEEMPGLLFGDTLQDLDEEGETPSAAPFDDSGTGPGQAVKETDSSSTPATSAGTGPPLSAVSSAA